MCQEAFIKKSGCRNKKGASEKVPKLEKKNSCDLAGIGIA